MKCIVCLTEVEAGEMACPQCGEHMGQWWELHDAGHQLIGAGMDQAREGDLIRAALNLTKATVLLPDSGLAFKTLGLVLAQLDIDDQAAANLEKAQTLLLQAGKSQDEQITKALEALQDKGEPASTEEAPATDAPADASTETEADDANAQHNTDEEEPTAAAGAEKKSSEAEALYYPEPDEQPHDDTKANEEDAAAAKRNASDDA